MMDSLFRLKDTIVGMLSSTPSPKRRRTGTESTSTAPDEDHFFVPRPPTNNNVQFDVHQSRWTPSAAMNPLKRRRSEDSEERETVLPEDSISQVMASVEVDSVVTAFEKKIKVEYISGGEEEDVVMGSGSGEEEDEEEEVAYDSEGNEIEFESGSESGSEVEVEYDSDGNVIEQEIEYDSDGNEIVYEEVEVDSDGNEIEVEEVASEVELDSDGNEIEYEVEDEEEGSGEEEEGSNSDVQVKEEELEESPEPDPEQIAAGKEQERLAREADLATRLEAIDNARLEEGWHPDELYLYERIEMRGFEPLLPLQWKIDFPSIPSYLFIDHNIEKPLISFNYGPPYTGVRTLQPLISAGAMVAWDESIDAADYISERRMYLVIFQFNRWVEQDGDYWKRRILPVLILPKIRAGQSAEKRVKHITDQMTFLAKRHREYLGVIEKEDGSVELDLNRRTPPLLYGILLIKRLVLIVTLDSADPKATIKTLRQFDLAQRTQSVWNGFGIALVCMAARNYLMAIREEFEIDDTPESDPDA